MADRSDLPSSVLTGKVMEDAVPLETMDPVTVEGIELLPGSTVSYQRTRMTLPAESSREFPPQTAGASTISSSERTPQSHHALPGNNRGQQLPSQQQPADQVSGAPGYRPSPPRQALPDASQNFHNHSQHDAQSELHSDVLKGVSKAVESLVSEEFCAVQNCSLSPTSSDQPSLESALKDISFVPIDSVGDKDIEEYHDKLPKNLKVDYFDAMILYQDDDRKHVERFLKRVNTEVMLKKVDKPKVVLYDQIMPDAGMNAIGQLDFTLPYCTYVFLYVTKSFCKDAWAEFSCQTCLMNAIESLESRWSVVPIFTEPKRNPTFKIPPSIRSLKGIQYWSDDKFYVDSLRKLLEDKLHIRKRNEEEHKSERRIWIMEEKGKEILAAKERRQKEHQAQEKQKMMMQQHHRMSHAQNDQFQRSLQDQRKIQIQEPKDFLDNYGYSASSKNPGSDQYFQAMYQHHSVAYGANPNALRESESAPSSLGQQAMSEHQFLQHSLSEPADPYSLPSNPCLSQFDYTDHHKTTEPGTKPCFYIDPAGSQSNPRFPRAAGLQMANQSPGQIYSPQQSGMFAGAGSPDMTTSSHSVAGHSLWQGSSKPPGPFSQQPRASGARPDSHPSYAREPHGSQSLPNLGRGVQLEHRHHQGNEAYMSSAPTARTGQLPEKPPMVREMMKDTVLSGDKTAGSSSQHTMGSSQRQAVAARGEADGKVGSILPPKINTQSRTKEEPPQKDDLVEDIPPESHTGHEYPPAPQVSTVGHLGQAFSEAVMEAPMIGQGPAHHASARARVVSDERRNYQYDPRLQHPANAGMGRFTSPMEPPRQYLPHGPYGHPYMHQPAYPGHHPHPEDVYRPPMYAPYPQQACPGYGGQPGYQQQHMPYWPYPAPAMQPIYYNQYGLPPPPLPPPPAPPPPQAQPYVDKEAPAVHHHHYHNQDEKVPMTTINYIKKVDHLMVADRINTKSKTPRIPAEQDTESAYDPSAEQDQWSYSHSQAGYEDRPAHQPSAEEQYFSGQSGGQRGSLGSQESGSESFPPLAPFTQHSNNTHSQLTETVTHDQRSCQSSVTSNRGAQLHLAELPSSVHQSHDRQSSPSLSPLSPMGVMDPPSGQWHRDFERQHETEYKTYVVGPDEI